MPELRVDAVLSDMDGVLVDTGELYDRHWAAWAERQGLDPELIVGKHHGRPAVLSIGLLLPDVDAAEEARAFNANLAADESARGVVALPGALAMAGALPAERWAICTSAPREMAERWLAYIGISLPAALVSVDDVARGKPAPDGYLRAAELLSRDPASCLVIEDAPTGITAARAAGAQVLAVQTTFSAEHLHDADHIVSGLDAIRFEVDARAIVVRWPVGDQTDDATTNHT